LAGQRCVVFAVRYRRPAGHRSTPASPGDARAPPWL